MKLFMAWPMPALLAWAACWCTFALVQRALGTPAFALLLAAGVGCLCSLAGATRWRRVFIAGGFPLSLAASGWGGPMPAWAWLVPLAVLALVYPMRSWRDAPLFPTPRGALAGLAKLAALPPGARIVDAGCGVGAGLRELHREYPQARLTGLEWSWPLRLVCAWRTGFATVRRADIWRVDWSGFDLVYLFQRPESMPRAAAKAAHELRDGAWLASLEFEVREWAPQHVLQCADGRRVWLYRAPFGPAATNETLPASRAAPSPARGRGQG